ncbi:FDLD family class I lanthipeptide [Cellulomonas sp. 179-A 9B4 NHS]|uniref:FDLD family class I lanthipeptide n=1 Tax=Cellulomonas sp. 179-A 9B4 NHS TaxID=3142379 RepID=UPI00399F86A3
MSDFDLDVRVSTITPNGAASPDSISPILRTITRFTKTCGCTARCNPNLTTICTIGC